MLLEGLAWQQARELLGGTVGEGSGEGKGTVWSQEKKGR